MKDIFSIHFKLQSLCHRTKKSLVFFFKLTLNLIQLVLVSPKNTSCFLVKCCCYFSLTQKILFFIDVACCTCNIKSCYFFLVFIIRTPLCSSLDMKSLIQPQAPTFVRHATFCRKKPTCFFRNYNIRHATIRD